MSHYFTMDSVVVRAPLLPVEFFFALDDMRQPTDFFSQATDCSRGDLINLALLVGSESLTTALDRPVVSAKKDQVKNSKLLRYLIRMSTRATPYGLFAGVSLAQWGSKTDVSLHSSPPTWKSRPDMRWLLDSSMSLKKMWMF